MRGGYGNLTVGCESITGSLHSRIGSIQVWYHTGNPADNFLKIENVNLRVTGENNGLRGPNVIVDNATITVEPSQYGTPDDSVLYADWDVTIQNGSVVTGTTQNAMWGICANGRNLTISDSQIKLKNTIGIPLLYTTVDDWSCYALQGRDNVSVKNSSVEIQMEMTKEATSPNYESNICGIVAGYKDIAIANSKIKINLDNCSADSKSYAYGIVAYDADDTGKVKISIAQDSEVAVSVANASDVIGVAALGTLEVDGSAVTSEAAGPTANAPAIEFLYSQLALKGVDVVEGTRNDDEGVITSSDTQNPTGGRSVIRPLGTDAGVASVTLGAVQGQLSGTDIAIQLPAGSKLPTNGQAFAIVPADNRATVGTPVSTDGGATWTFTVTAEDNKTSKTYTIHVTVVPSACAVHVSAGDGGTVTGAGNYAPGASVTVTAVPKSGYAFVRWTENGQEVSKDASYTFSATGERNLVAVFERKTDETPAGTPNLPQTGDNARLGLWLAGLAASLAMLAALTYARRRTIRRR